MLHCNNLKLYNISYIVIDEKLGTRDKKGDWKPNNLWSYLSKSKNNPINPNNNN